MEFVAGPIVAVFFVTWVILGGLSWTFLKIIDAIVAPDSRHPNVPRYLVMLIAWFLSMPLCMKIIDVTPLSSFSWGHAGELFFFPYFFFSILVLGYFVRRMSNERLS